MPQHHRFIFEPGKWVGEGTVGFSSSSEQMFFVTHWGIESKKDGGIRCEQEVKMEGADDKVHNRFHLYKVTSNSFNISIENEIVGLVVGDGIIDEQTIAWEFRGHIGFQGYEVYEKLPEGDYRFHAEYASADQFRTIIDGVIRKVDFTSE